MSQARAEFARLEAQVKALNTAMAQSVIVPGAVNPQGYDRMMRQMKVNSRVFRDAAASTGMFEAQQLRVNSATEEYTRLLDKQKVSFRDWRKQQAVAARAYREQLALQSMVVRRLPGTVGGKQVLDVVIPNEVNKSLDTFGNKVGWAREQLRSFSTQMVNWGKNTQWAGRQLMVGFTMPVAAFGAATGVLAYQVDKQMTRIQKVYDTTAKSVSGNAKSMIAVERELAGVRMDAMKTAQIAANQYGASVSDTLEIQAELAATGQKGSELQSATNQVMRIATLGEFDRADALKTVIALQSVMGYTAGQTAEQLNYMNSIENATSLATEDFAKAIPIALGPLKEMGGNVQDLALLLVAMKERGIEAGEGANAIKAMMQRLYRPSKQIRKEWEAITGTDITDIRDRNGGDIMKMLNDIATATEGLNRAQRVQAVGGLIGTYQVGRINAVLNGLRDLRDGVGQTSAVLKVNSQDTEQWAKTADNELQRWQKSVSGRFKTAVESIKVELAQMGEPFLEIGSIVISQVSKIISWFNKLPDGVKKFAAGTAIFMALVGPLVMLTGLFANFFGNMLKGGVFVTGLLTKFELLNKETAAARLASKLAADGFMTQGQAAAQLTAQIEKLTLAQLAAMRAAGQMTPYFAGSDMGAGYAPPVRARDARGRFLPATETNKLGRRYTMSVPSTMPIGSIGNPTMLPQAILPSTKQAGTMSNVADDAEKTEKHMRGAAAAGGIFAGAMAASLISSNETVDKVSQIAMTSAMLGPAIWGAFGALKSINWKMIGDTIKLNVGAGMMVASSGAKSFATNLKSAPISTLRGGIKAAGAGLIGMLGPVGLLTAGIAAAGAGMYLLYKNSNKLSDEVKKTYEDANDLSKILGYSVVDDGMTRTLDKAGNSIVGMEAKAQKFRESYQAVTSQIRTAQSDQEAFNLAMSQGLKVIHTGGTAEQAKEAVEVALRAAKSKAEADRIILKFKPELDFTNQENMVMQTLAQMNYKVNQALKNMGRKAGFWADILPGGDNTDQFIKKAYTLAEEAGKSASEAYVTAFDAGMSTESIEKAAQKQLDALNAAVKRANASGTLNEQIAADESRDRFLEQFISGRVDDEREFVNNLKAGATILDIMKRTGMTISVESQKTADATERAGIGASDFNTSMDSGAKNTERAGRAASRLRKEMNAVNEIDWSSTVKDAFVDTQDEVANIASENFSERMNKAMEAYQESQEARQDRLAKQQDREQERFDKRWDRRRDNVSEYYDNRIDKVNAAVEAEQKAEDIRQRIFEAEITRMQRLADMANRNIDFNVALNEGNLDEAAKIRNDMDAQEAEWALGDAADRSGRGSERRQNRLQNRIDNFEEAKDKRLEHLDEIENAERKALERSQERTRKALDREVEANIDAQQKIWDSRKENLDKAIELFKAYVPRNERELQNHINRVSNRYQDFNVDTRARFNNTAVDVRGMLQDNIKMAAESLRSDVRWAAIGNTVAREMIHGAFGMRLGEFRNWMVTGKWPKQVKPMTAKEIRQSYASDSRIRKNDRMLGDGPFLHTGGIAGVDKGGRKGIARTAPLSRNEVPSVLLKGEGVLNREAMGRIGEDGFHALNSGYGVGGGGLGFAGLMGALMARAIMSTVNQGVLTGAMNTMSRRSFSGSFTAGKAGIYGNTSFTPEQLKNAALISSVGKNMGMSSRDIQIGIMTAITESLLRNVDYGDRDSLGLFQQRPSQGWGSPTQVQDPTYAARKFFEALKGVPDRGSLPPWLAAQSVQRSAFADGSNYRQYWDEAQAIFAGLGRGNVAMNYAPGKGGWRRPAPRGYNWGNTHDYQVPIGTPLYAVSDGTIVESRAITSGGSPGNGLYSTPYRSYGETVVMRTASGDLFRWAHMSPGTRIGLGPVKGGTQIGRSGNTGNSTGPHVHMDVNGNYDALGWLRQHGIQLKTGGFTMTDGLANLHKEEVVVDPIRTRKLFQGIDNFANGGNNEYNITVQVMNPDANADQIVRKTMVALKRAENRKPQSRGSE